MRTLPATLLAAQKQPSRCPYLKVEAFDRMAGVARLYFQRLYTGSEPDYYHAVTMPGDGSLIRARLDATTYGISLQRVVNPGPDSNFSAWTGHGTSSAGAAIALCSRGANVLFFCVGTDQRTIYWKESTDYGATFGDWAQVLVAPSAVTWMAVDLSLAGVVALFFVSVATVYVTVRSGGVWGSASAWTNTLASVSGLATAYDGDWDLAVAGQDSAGDVKVWTCIYGDGGAQPIGTWSALAEVTRASAGSPVSFRATSLDQPDVFRLFFVEKHTGSQSYQRPQWSHSLASASFQDNLWREPVPFNLDAEYGLALTSGQSYAWLSCPSGVWRAPLTPPYQELTADVLSLRAGTRPNSGRLRIELRNDDGRHNSVGLGALRAGSELAVSPGYYTSAGAQASAGPSYWVAAWEHVSGEGQSRLVVHAVDGWGLLARWRARRQYRWAASEASVLSQLHSVFARAGLEVVAPGPSSTLTGFAPAFTISPGESGAEAARRLLALVPDVLYFRGGQAYLRVPSASDPTDYAYGTDHPLFAGHYRTGDWPVNRTQVYGAGVVAEYFSWDSIDQVQDRLRQIHDLNLTTLSQAQDRAQTEGQRAERETLGGEIVAPVNCGQELYDVIEVTDARAGLSAARRRVTGLGLEYSATGRPAYRQRLELGGV
ncbi:MAG: hypothetical protein HYY01_01235 [Chloroflexi bacterium]|nr:hypothetical protein [Chloroflexota bacterium]